MPTSIAAELPNCLSSAQLERGEYAEPLELTRIIYVACRNLVPAREYSARRSPFSHSDIPRVAGGRRAGAQPGADVLQRINDGDAGEVFDAFLAELASDTHAHRRAALNRQVVKIETLGEKRLRVHGLWQVDTVPPRVLNGVVNDPLGPLVDADQVQHVGERNADPLGDE